MNSPVFLHIPIPSSDPNHDYFWVI